MNKIDGRNFYDQISETYDENVNRGVIAGKIRTYIQESILKNITKNGTILDIGCGTGTDAIFFAEKGIKVLGFDVSHKMIEAAKYKAANKRLQQLVNFIEMDASDLKKLNNMKFDAAVSNLDALNYLDNLEKFSGELAELLNNGSKVFIVMLNKICLLESSLYFIKLKPLVAFKKFFNRGGSLEPELNLYFPRRVKKIFSLNYKTKSITAFGLLIPTDNFLGIYYKLQRLFNWLEKLEKFFAVKYPFYNFSDHYVIELEKI